MLKHFRSIRRTKITFNGAVPKRNFLSNEYKCNEAWNSSSSSPLIKAINLNDFYNKLDQAYTSQGTISAIDVDLFAHAVTDSIHLEELKDLLHKLRMSAETGNMLESTPHATVRNFIKMGLVQELVEILKNPLNFGVFLDHYAANMLLNELISSKKYDLAASVASVVMLQEDYSNELTCALCQYAAFKHIESYIPPEPEPPADPKKKVEEIKIRIKYLRNPYFDDHFDIKDPLLLSGKSLAWISKQKTDNLNNNLQLLGWLVYQKYEKLEAFCETASKLPTLKVYPEILEYFSKGINTEDENIKAVLEKCLSTLNNAEKVDTPIESALKNAIENAINKVQVQDIKNQQKLFKSWVEIREQRFEEQTKRLDRAKRIEIIQEKQKELNEEEQKLWFFENEEKIDLEIEEKEAKVEKPTIIKKSKVQLNDDNYVPPEILPQKRK